MWITGGGVLAASLAQQQSKRTLRPGEGALLGLTAGVIGAFVWLAAYSLVDLVVGPLQQRMVASMLEGPVDMPPEVVRLLESVSAQASSPLRYAVGFAVQLMTGVTFGAIGGLIGALYFTRDVPPALGGDPIEPPPIPE